MLKIQASTALDRHQYNRRLEIYHRWQCAGSTEWRLEQHASKTVWDFGFDATNTIYLATDDGVYRGNGNTNSAWQPFDVQIKGLRSLELVGDQLYVGLVNAAWRGGVWRHALTGGDWQPVTSPNWNNTYHRTRLAL